jgi:hypothetical protein
MASNGAMEHQVMQAKYYVRALLAVALLWVMHAGAEEQLEQDTISIKGSQGLPKTLYIAPWKRVGAPLDSDQLEGDIREETQPVERDIFQRELELQRQGYSVD